MGSPDPKTLTVEDAMVDEPYTVDMETPLVLVLETMASRHIGAALVTRRGRLAGIFTTRDACAAFADHLRREFPSPDAAGPPEVA